MLKGVSLQGVRPELLFAYIIAWTTAEELGADNCVIPAVRDGQHSWGSLHYAGCAIDLDVIGWNSQQIAVWSGMVKQRLSDEFDVITHSGHMHIEHQPKNNTRV
jgi:hypothetical protein